MTPEELAVVQAAMRWHDAVLTNPDALRPLHNANNKLTPVLSELSRTTWKLATTCPECNAGGHTCPGDGNPIPHGAKDCGRHDEEVKHAGADGACPDYGSHLDPCPPGCASGTCVVNAGVTRDELAAECDNCAPLRANASVTRVDGTGQDTACVDCGWRAELIWVPRTWVDVRTGDRVRMPGSDAVAYVRSAVHLRWHVKPGTGTSQYNPPAPLEWAGVRVTLKMHNPNADEWSEMSYEMDPAKPVEIEIDRDTAETAALMHGGPDWWANRVGICPGEAR